MPRVERNSYVKDYPEIKGLSEIHIFLEPLNPSDETIKKYEDAVAEYNATQLAPDNTNTMKACVLCLEYRGKGDVTVLQSSRYLYSNDTNEVIEETYKDGKWFSERGFTLLRHKVECITTCKGVPQKDDEWQTNPDRYFEFHIRVCPAGGSENAEIKDSEIEFLKSLSREFTDKYQIPVPLSYNKSRLRHQRYLNVRFANCGAETARKGAMDIKEAIRRSDTLEWVKTISEYVWYDDHRAVDQGWIDFEPHEKEQILGLTAK